MKKFVKISPEVKRLVRWIIFIIALGIISWVILFLKETQVLPQGAISLLDELPQFVAEDRVIIFSPHPDDESLCCAASIQRAINNGAEVFIVLITNGNKKGLKNTRYQEFIDATNLLKIDDKRLFFLNYQDGELKEVSEEKLKTSFRAVIDEVKPTIVFIPSDFDNHLDHKISGQNLKEFLSDYKDITVYQYLIHHGYFPRPIGYHPNLYLLPPISSLKFENQWLKLSSEPEEIALKKQIIYHYKSQLKKPPLKELLPAFIRLNEIFLKKKD